MPMTAKIKDFLIPEDESAASIAQPINEWVHDQWGACEEYRMACVSGGYEHPLSREIMRLVQDGKIEQRELDIDLLDETSEFYEQNKQVALRFTRRAEKKPLRFASKED